MSPAIVIPDLMEHFNWVFRLQPNGHAVQHFTPIKVARLFLIDSDVFALFRTVSLFIVST